MSRAAVHRLVAQHDAELFDDTNAWFYVTVWTPPGFVWVATGCHVIAVRNYTSRPDGWKALLVDMRDGTRPCDTDDCENCDEESE